MNTEMIAGLACMAFTLTAMLHRRNHKDAWGWMLAFGGAVGVLSLGIARLPQPHTPRTSEEWAQIQEMFRAEAADLPLIAYAIWYEARGEEPIGRRAVATVIWNRAGGDPERLTTVLMRKDWLGNKPKLDTDDGDWSDPILMQVCWDLATELRLGQFKPLGPWTHFWNPDLASPSWRRAGTNNVRIGNHMFCLIP
jgi:hypothetical protein